MDIVILPKRIGHAYTNPVLLDIGFLYMFPLNVHRRLKVFYNYGLNCRYCNKVGIYLIKAFDRFGGAHIDVYTKDFDLMTIDHVIPKSKGGGNDLDNLVPCCDRCNVSKLSKNVDDWLNTRKKERKS